MVKWIIVAILLLPLAEIVAFILVAAVAGVGVALLLMLATSLAGFAVLRRAGRGGIARFRVAVADTDVAGIQANTGGFLTVLAGLLLFLPGFLTDLVGAAAADRAGAPLVRQRPSAMGAPAVRPIPPPSISRRASGRNCPTATLPTTPPNVSATRPFIPARGAFLSAWDRCVSHTRGLHRQSHRSRESIIVSTTNGGPAPATATIPPPQMMVLAQYIKDLSFENPNAPRSLQQSQQPQINIGVNVTANPMTDTDIEVMLKLEGKAEAAGSVMFNIELEYRRRVPHPERAAGARSAAGADRMPALPVSVRPRDRRHIGAQRRLPAADARSDRFRRALSAAHRARPAAGNTARHGVARAVRPNEAISASINILV